MKKILIFIATIFLFSASVTANNYSETFSKIENMLYGFEYNNDSSETRLSRIEDTIYGVSRSGNIDNRVSKLEKDISASNFGKEITPVEDTFEEVADANIQYPAVDELEQIIFSNIFQNKDIKSRLSALEEKTFGRAYDDDLASRVDRLKAEIKPNSFINNQIAQSSNDFYYDDIVPLEKNYHLERYDSPSKFDYEEYNSGKFSQLKKANITNVENSVLRRTYQDDKMQNRLSRLENAMFGTQFNEDDEQTRLNRISSAYKAQKSASKYDSNKFSQNMSTAIQIGSMLLMILACIL